MTDPVTVRLSTLRRELDVLARELAPAVLRYTDRIEARALLAAKFNLLLERLLAYQASE